MKHDVVTGRALPCQCCPSGSGYLLPGPDGQPTHYPPGWDVERGRVRRLGERLRQLVGWRRDV